MADYVITVDYADLDKAATDFNSQLSQVKTITNKMLEVINDTGSTWTGEASAKYIGKFNSLRDDMEKIHSMIDEHITDLKEISGKYKTAEEQNVQIASKLQENVF